MTRARPGTVPHILHLHSTFAPGGKELRTVQLINALGKKARHTIVSGEPAEQGYDLVCTYNWGAMDAAMAHTLFKDLHGLPPLIHHEDGFDETELKKLKKSRTWYRRIALGKA